MTSPNVSNSLARNVRALTLFALGMLWLTVLTSAVGQEPRTLTVGISADVTTLDPTVTSDTRETRIKENIFETLVRRSKDGGVVPALAESWSVSDDGLMWTFQLREGVRFHNGEEFNAETVKYSFERIFDPTIPSYEGYWGTVDEVRIDGSHQVTFVLSEPNPLMLTNIPGHFPMVPQQYIEEVGAETFSREPIGTGPYRLTDWRRGERLVLEANPDYYLGEAPYQRLVLRILVDEASRFAALLAGDVDITGPLGLEQITVAERAPGVRVSSAASLDRRFLRYRTEVEPFDDVRVRQALNYAVDKESIVEHVLGGYGRPLASANVPAEWGYSELEPYPYDPERARELLAEAGHADGFSFRMDYPEGRFLKATEVAQAVAGYLSEVGVEANLNRMDYSNWIASARGQTVSPAYLAFWAGGGVFHASHPFAIDFACEGGSPNWSWTYCNEQLDARLQEAIDALSSNDEDQAREIFAELQHMAQEEAPWLFLYVADITYGVSDDVDWDTDANESLWFYEASPVDGG